MRDEPDAKSSIFIKEEREREGEGDGELIARHISPIDIL
jgi:hypothetical protein